MEKRKHEKTLPLPRRFLWKKDKEGQREKMEEERTEMLLETELLLKKMEP